MASVLLPFVPSSVTRTDAAPASTSLTVMALPLPVDSTREVLIEVFWVDGNATAGASFTAATVMETVSPSLSPPASMDRTVSVSPPAKLLLPR